MHIITRKSTVWLALTTLVVSLLAPSTPSWAATPEQMLDIVNRTQSITATCSEQIQAPVEASSTTCTSRTYTDKVIIELFQQAIVHSTPSQSSAQQATDYELSMKTTDNEVASYQLSLGHTYSEPALLTISGGSSQIVQEISTKQADILRNLLLKTKSPLTFAVNKVQINSGTKPLPLQYLASIWTTVDYSGNEVGVAGVGYLPGTTDQEIKEKALQLKPSSQLNVQLTGTPTQLNVFMVKDDKYIPQKLNNRSFAVPAKPGYYEYSVSAKWDEFHNITYGFGVYVK
ncbi:hypothetical protein [Paenibacillus sp. WLX2291]|uniref:hypothetical protein n=1 Tax=Paenibacillus sp. WLX2291 TaxID=3296934 RepID=UPI0039844CEB